MCVCVCVCVCECVWSMFFWTVDSLILLGVILRDSHGVAQVRYVTGNKILRILKAKGMYCLIYISAVFDKSFSILLLLNSYNVCNFRVSIF